jgi:FG-GAP-like repeat/Galactose oxidase, central domain
VRGLTVTARGCGLLLCALASAAPSAAQDSGQWTATRPGGAPAARFSHTAVWTGSKMIVWGGFVPDRQETNTGGLYDPATNTWTPTSTVGALSGHDHTAVWAGSKMIVWGAFGPRLDVPGQIYDPATDEWTAVSPLGAEPRFSHTAVWTGSKMIVWGGSDVSGSGDLLDTGGIYDPDADTWTPISDTGAPLGCFHHTAVWTGSKMIVWGGYDDSGSTLPLAGAIYDPEIDTWAPMSTAGGPAAGRAWHTAVWTGSKMIVWGGWDGAAGSDVNTGWAYDPVTDTWTGLSTASAPSARDNHTAVWTGSKMIVWGGWGPGPGDLDTGGIYDPRRDAWTATSLTGAPEARPDHRAVWTGRKMIVWGGISEIGYQATGGMYTTPGAGPNDFNADGRPDLLWHNQSTGQLYAWLMDGTSQSSGTFLTPASVSPVWQVRGIGDLDGDGNNDLLWQHQSTGQLYAWLMDGTSQSSGTFLTPASVSPVWQVQGLGDFDGDGKLDILWRNQTTGQLYAWFMNGTSLSYGMFLTPSAVAGAWQVRGLADFDGDGKLDILWHNTTTGQVYVWFMNGTVQSSGSFLTPAAVANTSWRVAQVSDFDGDGKPDLLWRNQSTGQLYVWLMNGVMQSTGMFLTPPSVANPAWQISPR